MPKSEKIVRRTLADGTVREYRYQCGTKAAPTGPEAGTIAALIRAFERSPEWAAFAPGTKIKYRKPMTYLEGIGAVRVEAVRRRVLIAMRDEVVRRSGPGAANVAMSSWSRLLGWAVERDWIEHNPASGVRQLPGGHLLAWTAAEADRAQADLPGSLARVITLARYTGQRRGDLIQMTWSAYDGAAIRVTQAKTGARLVVPVHPVLRAELGAWCAALRTPPAASDCILLTETGRPWTPNHLSDTMGDELRALGMRPGLNVHGLRKLAAHTLAEAGCTTHEIGAITGHTTLSMIALYTAAASQEQLAQSAISKLENAFGKRSENGL